MDCDTGKRLKSAVGRTVSVPGRVASVLYFVGAERGGGSVKVGLVHPHRAGVATGPPPASSSPIPTAASPTGGL